MKKRSPLPQPVEVRDVHVMDLGKKEIQNLGVEVISMPLLRK
tara:strand:+ start:86 stop:211 length:126 start_codon:yes stop_codon:yes gene_type:complete